MMQRRGLPTEAIHGDLSQNQRDRVIEGFKKKKFVYMVATDVAARGLDIDNVTHVFNYDIPKEKENYVHRIGRTGRAGKSGKAISFITPSEVHDLWEIEHVARTKINETHLENPVEVKERPERPKLSPYEDYGPGQRGSYARPHRGDGGQGAAAEEAMEEAAGIGEAVEEAVRGPSSATETGLYLDGMMRCVCIYTTISIILLWNLSMFLNILTGCIMNTLSSIS